MYNPLVLMSVEMSASMMLTSVVVASIMLVCQSQMKPHKGWLKVMAATSSYLFLISIVSGFLFVGKLVGVLNLEALPSIYNGFATLCVTTLQFGLLMFASQIVAHVFKEEK